MEGGLPRKSTCGVGSGVCTQGDRLQLTFQPIEAAGLARTPSRTWRKQTSIVRVVRSSSKQHRCCEHAPSHGLINSKLHHLKTFKFELKYVYDPSCCCYGGIRHAGYPLQRCAPSAAYGRRGGQAGRTVGRSKLFSIPFPLTFFVSSPSSPLLPPLLFFIKLISSNPVASTGIPGVVNVGRRRRPG